MSVRIEDNLTPLPVGIILCDRCGSTVREEDDRDWLAQALGTSRVAVHSDPVLCSLLAAEYGDPNRFDSGDYGPRVPNTEDYP